MSLIADLIDSVTDPFQYTADDSQHAQQLIEALLTEGQIHQQANWAAHMTSPTLQASLLGKLLAAQHNGNLLSAGLYPQLAAIESQLINWFCNLFGQQYGHFTHGSSYANLEALWQARDRTAHSSTIVYGSQAAHYSIIKACQILGLHFQPIVTDEQGQMNIDALQSACQQQAPVAIVATAGSSSCGAIDPLSSIIEIAHSLDSWCHIDAAWGGALQLLDGHKLQGIEKADSLCFDPHKALAQPKPCSILLYQQPLDRLEAVDYLSDSPKKTLAGSYGGELFLPLWCSLLLDKQGLMQALEQRLQQAALFAHLLKSHTSCRVWHSATAIVCFKPQYTVDLAILEKQGLLSRSKINDEAVYRVVFASHLSQAQQIFTELAAWL